MKGKSPSVVSFIDIDDDNLKKGGAKWSDTVTGKDGKLYGVPYLASRVVQFDTKALSMKAIGPDLGEDGGKCDKGVLADNGKIYCIPFNFDKVIVIDTNTGETNGNVSFIENDQLKGGGSKYVSAAFSKMDNCIYCMPYNAKRILKINTNNDSCEFVGEQFDGSSHKYYGTVAVDYENENKTILYGIPFRSRQIIKFDPCDNSIENVGGKNKNEFKCGDGVLASDGNIYFANKNGDILKFNVVAGIWTIIKKPTNFINADIAHPTIGKDGCIYWLKVYSGAVMKLNTISQQPSLIRGETKGVFAYKRGALASNGRIYYLPHNADQVMEIDTRPAKMLYTNKAGGTSDSPHGEPDRLGYHVYAEALSKIVRAVETPGKSLCIGLFAPWGGGKTFTYDLVMDYLIKSAESSYEPIENDESRARWLEFLKELVGYSFMFAGVVWYYFTLLIRAVLFCGNSTSQGQQTDEFLATIVVLSFPIGFIIWILAFAFVFVFGLPFVLLYRCISYSHEREERIKRWKRIFKRWKSICDILTGRTRLLSDRSFRNSSCLQKFRALLLISVQMAYQHMSALLSIPTRSISFLFPKRYEVEEEMTKYIFVNFNAWEYSGTDLLWAKLLDQLWTKVENECGKYSVRWHRARIKFSDEDETDDAGTKRSKRENGMAKLVIKGLLSLLLSTVITVLALTFDWENKIAKFLAPIISSIPVLYLIIKTSIEVIPDLLQSRGAKILKDVQSFESYDRQDFSEKTGFMGEVHTEVKYLFDFLRTTHVADDTFKVWRPIRISLFVDDLDRCPKKAVMSILEAVTLLLFDESITAWLAIDSRLVVACIEEHFGDVFTNAGVDGYAYLEKLIQIPFCIPDIDDIKKNNFLQNLLVGKELDYHRTFQRLQYFVHENVEGLKDLLEDGSTEPKSKKEGRRQMIGVLEKLIERDAFRGFEGIATSSPESILAKAKEEESMSSVGSEQLRLQDQLLYWVSNGIELILGRERNNANEHKEDKELRYRHTFRRLKDLMNKNVEGSEDLLEDDPTEPTSKEEGFTLMVSVLEKLIKREAFRGFEGIMTSTPESILAKAKEEESMPSVGNEQLRLQDQLLYWVSKGIELTLGRERNNVNEENEGIPASEVGSPDVATNRYDIENPHLSGEHNNESISFRDSYDYERVFQPFVSPLEVGWFDSYAKYFIGKPRKMKRVVNSYMLSRFVANIIRQEDDVSGSVLFYKNLMKFIVLLEQWPYRMAWMLLVVENLQQEIENRDMKRKAKVSISSSFGDSLLRAFVNLAKSGNESSDSFSEEKVAFSDFKDLCLYKVYNGIVRAFIHSSEDSAKQLRRDGDPQIFEQILLEDTADRLMIKNVSVPTHINDDTLRRHINDDTLRPYAFNLQRHMVEKVSVEMENRRLVLGSDGKIAKTISKLEGSPPLQQIELCWQKSNQGSR